MTASELFEAIPSAIKIEDVVSAETLNIISQMITTGLRDDKLTSTQLEDILQIHDITEAEEELLDIDYKRKYSPNRYLQPNISAYSILYERKCMNRNRNIHIYQGNINELFNRIKTITHNFV